MKTSRGFTLIELLVVISIIGLLASVVLLALNGARAKARDAKRVADLNQLAKVFELYFNDYFSYPTSTSACIIGTGSCLTNLVPKYLSGLPTAPVPADSGGGFNCGSSYGIATANDYQFASSTASTAANYTVTFCLGNKTGALSAGVHTLTNGGMQ